MAIFRNRLGRILINLVLILIALPFALMLLYLVVPPISNLMLLRWVTLQPAHREWVPLSQISPQLLRAVIVSEDAKFCSHHGVDWDSLQEVVEDADEDGPDRGASTITMQVVKNTLLWPGRSYIRKGLEIPLALVMDAAWGKRRILEVYLNVAEWGDGVFGAEAAAQYHFHHSAKNLSAQEAALLATALPNPHKRRAGHPGPGLESLAGALQQREATEGANLSCVRR